VTTGVLTHCLNSSKLLCFLTIDGIVMAADVGDCLYKESRTAPITEQPNEFARDIDCGCASDIVRTLCQCDSQIFSGWENYPTLYDAKTISSMVKISEWAVEVLENSNDTAIVLSGCGTSGRMAFFLARKFSQLAEAQQMSANYDYLIAGGDVAVLTALEATEDDWRQGREDLEKVSGNKSRVLFIGITCGLSAPYVAAQLDYCMCRPDVFIPVLIGFNPLKQAKQNVIEGWNKSFFQVARSLQGNENCKIYLAEIDDHILWHLRLCCVDRHSDDLRPLSPNECSPF